MNTQQPFTTLEVAVLSEVAHRALQPLPATVVVHPPFPKRLIAGTLVVALLLSSITLYGVNAWYTNIRDSQAALQQEILSLRQHSLAEAGRTTQLVNLWQENLRQKDANIAALQEQKARLEVELATTRAALAEKSRRLAAAPATRPAPPVQTAQMQHTEPPPPDAPLPTPTPTSPAGPEPAPTVTAKLDPPPPAPRSRVAKFFRNPIFLDSAVLAGSLFVPPSLPITLAQSRLGRSLANRIMKKTHTDKTVAGRVAAGVTNMPITQGKRR